MGSQKSEIGFIVLPDDALNENQKISNKMVADYNGNQDDIEKDVTSFLNNTSKYIITFNTKKDIRDASVGLGAIVTFFRFVSWNYIFDIVCCYFSFKRIIRVK